MSGPVRWLALVALVFSFAVLNAPLSPQSSVALAPDMPVAQEPPAPCPSPVATAAVQSTAAQAVIAPTDPFPRSSTVVTPEAGGILSATNGLVSIAIPPGAVSENAELSIEGRAVDGARTTYTAYEFSLTAVREKDGSALAQFNVPLTYTLSPPPGSIDPAFLPSFSLLWFNPTGNYWYAVDSKADAATGSITAATPAVGAFELASDPKLQTTPGEEVVYPQEGGVLSDDSGQVTVTFSPGDTTERLAVSYSAVDPCTQHPSDQYVIREFQLTAKAIDRGDAPVATFQSPVELRVSHTFEELIAFAPETLGLYHLNDGTGLWEPVPSSVVGQTITAQVDHFSDYSTQAQTDVLLPRELKYFQVDMQSGSSTASIPLELPRGPGGFGPDLALTYSSSAVNEMKSSKSMASWVGVGWGLSVPTITRDPIKGRYFLSMSGVSDLLIREDSPIPAGQPNEGRFRWHTKREQYVDITSVRCGNDGTADVYHQFYVRTKAGIRYEFGTKPGAGNCPTQDPGDPNFPTSLQFFTRYGGGAWHRYHYRMDVSQITDTSGNQVAFTYWQDVRTDSGQGGVGSRLYVRSAYPLSIDWGANPPTQPSHVYRVTFTLASDWNLNWPNGDQGDVRHDAPIETGTPLNCPQPHVMETRKLELITVEKYDETNIRQYDLTYINDPSTDTISTCALSGNLRLDSVKQTGSSGGELRTLSFTYLDGADDTEIRYSDSARSATNCPSGITGAKERPYLKLAGNGFGGNTEFVYTRQWGQITQSSPICGWERLLVTKRTLKPGAGQPDQVYEYPSASYVGPTYWYNDATYGIAAVDAEFRGFTQVKEENRKADTTLLGSLVCTYETSAYKTGLATQCEWKDDGGNVLKKVVNSYTLTSTCSANCDSWEGAANTLDQPELEESNFVPLVRTETTGANGNPVLRTGYTYDPFYGNVLLVCEYSSSSTESGCPVAARYRITGYVYPVANNSTDYTKYIVGLPEQKDVRNGADAVEASTQFYYDGQAFGTAPTEGLLTQIDTLTDTSTYITTSVFNHDDYGNRTAETDGENHLTVTSYQCSNTQPHQVTTGGKTTTYAYNCGLGLPETITGPDGVADNIRYDEHGLRTKEWLPGDTEGSPTTAYTYDWDSALPNSARVDRRETAGGGTLWEVSCVDGFGRLVQTRREMPSTSASVIDIAYDAAGNKASESIPYSASGATCGGAGTAPKTQYTSYDVLGRVLGITNADGTSRAILYTSAKVKTTNERGYCTEQDVDSFGRVTEVKEFTDTACTVSKTTSYTYDEGDRLKAITDAASPANTTTIDYDKAGRKLTLTDPDSGPWSYTYYKDGRLWTQTDARGVKVEMAYDSLGRIKTKTYTNGGASAAPTVTYTYDTCQIGCPNASSNGHLTMVQEWAETQKFRYDVRGRVEIERHEVAGLTLDVTRAYDSLGRVTSTAYPGTTPETVTNTYDAGGSISSAIGTSTYLESSTWNAAFLPESLVLGNALSLLFDYRNVDNKDFRLKNVRISPSPPNLMDYTYEYDGVGNVTKATDGTLTSGNVGTYYYDYADRVTSVTGLPDVIGYSYDAIGNMTEKAETPVTPNYTANPGPGMFYGAGAAGPHALTSATSWVSGVSRSHVYEYDATGNMLREKMNGQVVHEFQYDAAGHVFFRRSEPFATNGYDYYYNNSDGTLVRRVKVGSVAEDVIYAGDLYERHTVNGVSTDTKYYYADGRRIAMRVGSALYFLATDHLGGTSVVMNSAGAQVNRVRYYPYGSIRTVDPSGATPVTDRLFTGQQRMSENGIYNYGARFYNAMTGRFLQADAVVPGPGNPQALNRYSYVLNNPMRYTDPTGNCVADSDGYRGCGLDSPRSQYQVNPTCLGPLTCVTQTPGLSSSPRRPGRPCVAPVATCGSTPVPTPYWRGFQSTVLIMNEDRSCEVTAHADCVFAGGWEELSCVAITQTCNYLSHGQFTATMEGLVRLGKLDVGVRLRGSEHHSFAVANAYWAGVSTGSHQLDPGWTNGSTFTYGGTVELTGPVEAVEIEIYVEEGGYRRFWYDLTTDTVSSTATHPGAYPR